MVSRPPLLQGSTQDSIQQEYTQDTVRSVFYPRVLPRGIPRVLSRPTLLSDAQGPSCRCRKYSLQMQGSCEDHLLLLRISMAGHCMGGEVFYSVKITSAHECTRARRRREQTPVVAGGWWWVKERKAKQRSMQKRNAVFFSLSLLISFSFEEDLR